MITNILATVAALGVVASLYVVLYGWFTLSVDRFQRVTAKDVLNRWDAHLAQLTDIERAQARNEPPVEVLNALLELPSPRPWRIQLNYSR